MTERAPAKINLCLFLGPTRPADGRHELVTVFEPLDLADTVALDRADGDADEVVCPGVEGPNLAADALAAFRAATGWDGAPVRLTIDKRIPVAAGMAGGSADAAAALRLAHRASGLGDEALLLELATGLGADVPGQVRPRRVLAIGAGEHLHELPGPAAPYGVLVVPGGEGLSTGAVFGEADRLGLARDGAGMEEALAAVRAAGAQGALAHATGGLPLVNELEPPARSLRPAIGDVLDAVRAVGADHAMVSGSGPTVLGLFADPEAAERAARDLVANGHQGPPPLVSGPLRHHVGRA